MLRFKISLNRKEMMKISQESDIQTEIGLAGKFAVYFGSAS